MHFFMDDLFLFFCLQSVPTGQPKLVTPSLAKLDVDALRRDIPRYQHNMPKEASDTWEKWLHQLDELTFVPASYCCPIEKLAKSARTEPAPPTSLIAPDLLELRERETQQTQEVSPTAACGYHGYLFIFFLFPIKINVMEFYRCKINERKK